jgi:hypothetical protein
VKGTEQIRDRDERPVATAGITLFPRIGEHPGFTLWRVSLALVAVMFALAAFQVQGLSAWVGVTAATAWCVTWTRAWTAAAAGVEAWAVQTGFGVHRYGELTFTRSDLVHLAAVVAVTLLVATITGGSPGAVTTGSCRQDGVVPSRRREGPGSGR